LISIDLNSRLEVEDAALRDQLNCCSARCVVASSSQTAIEYSWSNCLAGFRSSLGNPGCAHAFYHTLELRQIGLIVARRAGTEAEDGEGRIERNACLNRCPRFIEPTEVHKGGSEVEMRRRKVLIGLEAPAKPEAASSSSPSCIFATPAKVIHK
jgi:hypothetical protein